MNRLLTQHPGTSLVELILFLSFFAVAGGMVISILFSTNEQRMHQRTILNVERTGAQLLQVVARHVQNAERIIDPPAGSTGSVLALMVAAESGNPTIIAVQSGALMVVKRDAAEILPHDAPLSHFAVRNTSPDPEASSIVISFTIELAVPFPSGGIRTYVRHFERLIPLLPDDYVTGDACGCADPECSQDSYRWEVCESGLCMPSTAAVPCDS
ncbi:MAG: hypothetical protein PHS73_01545 [Candidatus Peribacteraceae bacterium]|nr:hypothetical protein [Candidatus Peribacteraceae bacterium]